jgi:hypothetical protein
MLGSCCEIAVQLQCSQDYAALQDGGASCRTLRVMLCTPDILLFAAAVASSLAADSCC